MTRLAELKEKQNALKAEMLAESRKAFSEITKDIFAKHQKLGSFSWRQYTPYFNDGDECVFSAQTDYLDYVWDGKEHEDISVNAFDSAYRTGEFKADLEFKGCAGAIAEMFKDMDKPTLKEMFGDHVKVTARRDNVEVEGYKHD